MPFWKVFCIVLIINVLRNVFSSFTKWREIRLQDNSATLPFQYHKTALYYIMCNCKQTLKLIISKKKIIRILALYC